MNSWDEVDEFIFNRDGIFYADSRKLSSFFKQRHDLILKYVEDIIRIESLWALRNFQKFRENKRFFAKNYYEMTLDGVAIVVMGLHTDTALKWKLKILHQFKNKKSDINKASQSSIFVNDEQNSLLSDVILDKNLKILELNSKISSLSELFSVLQNKINLYGL